eukprot:CAMPEP_0183509766 /NCGR_PEP_ID=MMETSP0371-20130417/9838_1 /TAXON_ID=268820 /ORGANISM="Peridinium aciculiferum, Strain PAER-2" /LENGTH=50 /DNA_ID=CAMNT_0025706443 /DNA_START=90 /DNA_END=238 /DNA_ORIENTATION=-
MLGMGAKGAEVLAKCRHATKIMATHCRLAMLTSLARVSFTLGGHPGDPRT